MAARERLARHDALLDGASSSTADSAQLLSEQAWLRSQLEHSLTELEQLRSKAEQLRDMELLLLRERRGVSEGDDPPLVDLSPSDFGKMANWQAAQFASGKESPFLSFCPPHTFPDAVPACLVSPAFGRFLDVVNGAADVVVSAEDYDAVHHLCMAMCSRPFDTEEERARELKRLPLQRNKLAAFLQSTF